MICSWLPSDANNCICCAALNQKLAQAHRCRLWGAAQVRTPNNWAMPMHLSVFTIFSPHKIWVFPQYFSQVYANAQAANQNVMTVFFVLSVLFTLFSSVLSNLLDTTSSLRSWPRSRGPHQWTQIQRLKFIEHCKLYCDLRTVHFKSLSKFNVSLELDLCSYCQRLHKPIFVFYLHKLQDLASSGVHFEISGPQFG